MHEELFDELMELADKFQWEKYTDSYTEEEVEISPEQREEIKQDAIGVYDEFKAELEVFLLGIGILE